jgi:hypothetical protein
VFTCGKLANEAIAEGKVTAVALGRALLADPQWVNKAAEGKISDIRPCIGCSVGCIGRIFTGHTMPCAVNADLFNEANQALIPAEKPKKIAANVPDYKAASRRLIDWFEQDLAKAGVKV